MLQQFGERQMWAGRSAQRQVREMEDVVEQFGRLARSVASTTETGLGSSKALEGDMLTTDSSRQSAQTSGSAQASSKEMYLSVPQGAMRTQRSSSDSMLADRSLVTEDQPQPELVSPCAQATALPLRQRITQMLGLPRKKQRKEKKYQVPERRASPAFGDELDKDTGKDSLASSPGEDALKERSNSSPDLWEERPQERLI